jgi:penicillin amidase
MRLIQTDEVSYVGRDLVQAVRTALPAAKLTTDAARTARAALLDWSFDTSIGSHQQTTAMRLLAVVATLVSKETGSSVWSDAVFLINAMEHGDEACGGSCLDFFAKALANASSDDGLPKQWGVPGRHMATFTHQVLGKSPFACLADRTVPHGGDFSTVNVGHGDLSDPHFPQTAGSSYRQIVDMANLESSLFLNPLGQSGALFSPLYDNLLKAWQDSTYLPMQTTAQPGAFSKQLTKKSA